MSTTPQSAGFSADATTPQELQSEIANALGSTDTLTTQRFQNLGLVHQARVNQLTRSAASITAQYGAGSTEASAAQALVATAKLTAARVAVVNQQIATPTPQVPANGWVLHGRVFLGQLQPASAYTVFLVDAQKVYQSAYGFAYTDSTGYFQLNATAPVTGAQSTNEKDQQAEGAAAGATGQFYIEVANAKGQPVFLSATPFQPVRNTATYENVLLPTVEKPIGDPPAAVRASALPNASSK